MHNKQLFIGHRKVDYINDKIKPGEGGQSGWAGAGSREKLLMGTQFNKELKYKKDGSTHEQTPPEGIRGHSEEHPRDESAPP